MMDQTLLQQGIAGAVALSCTYMATDVSGSEYMNGLVEGSIYRKQSFFLTPHDQGLRFRLSLQILGMSDVFVVSCGHKVGDSDIPSSLAGGSQGWPTATPAA